MLLAACLSCSRMEPVMRETGIPMHIDASVASGATRAAIMGTSLPSSRAIAVGVRYDAASYGAASPFSGVLQFRHTQGSSWGADAFWPVRGNVSMLGYSLEDTSHASSVTWGGDPSASVTIVLADNRRNQDDLVFACGEGMTVDSNALSFSHSQALVSVTGRSNIAYDAVANRGFTLDDVVFCDIYNSGTVTAARSGGSLSLTWSALGSRADVRMPGAAALHLGVTDAPVTSSPGLLVPAQAACPSVMVSYTYHDGIDASGYPVDVSRICMYALPSGVWAPGGSYIYRICITELGIDVTLEDDIIWDPAPAKTFAGFELSPGPLYYNGTSYEMKDDWTVNSYYSVHGENAGSTYFSFEQMGNLFEKAGFAHSDGDIDNVLRPFGDWRIPTEDEWQAIIGYDGDNVYRRGARVNGVAGVHYAILRLAGIRHANDNSPFGLLLFPDGEVITGRALSGYDSATKTADVTVAELDEYLAQGCVFLPYSGLNGTLLWTGGGSSGYYWTATQGTLSTYSTALYMLDGVLSNYITFTDKIANTHDMPVRLIR